MLSKFEFRMDPVFVHPDGLIRGRLTQLALVDEAGVDDVRDDLVEDAVGGR